MSSVPGNSDWRTCSPVRLIDTPSPHKEPESGLALCLSGGGYRAMLFHLGVLWRLSELGYLSKLDRISSVSGGSITAAMLGLRWERLSRDGNTAQSFEREIVAPIRQFARKTIDWPAIAIGLLPFVTISGRIISAYQRHLFGQATLQALPDRPRFVFNATNLQSGALWRFMKPYMRDYRVGEIKTPKLPLAVAVAASSAFPPFLSPVRLKPREGDYTPGSGQDLEHTPYTTDVLLTDGGVYDNLGLETAWKRYDTILVSDAGGHMEADPKPKGDWVRQSVRVLALTDNQVRSLRKRQVIDAFVRRAQIREQGESIRDEAVRLLVKDGAYWGIRTQIEDYHLNDALPCPEDETAELAHYPTRLAHVDDRTQERLINWGYAVCDAAMRKHVDPKLESPKGFPYLGGVG